MNDRNGDNEVTTKALPDSSVMRALGLVFHVHQEVSVELLGTYLAGTGYCQKVHVAMFLADNLCDESPAGSTGICMYLYCMCNYIQCLFFGDDLAVLSKAESEMCSICPAGTKSKTQAVSCTACPLGKAPSLMLED